MPRSFVLSGKFHNTGLAYTDLLKRTMPAGWTGETTNTPALFRTAQEQNRKYMLLSDDPERNVSDMLQVLQAVLDNGIGGGAEVFIRGDENRLAPVVDSALHHMGSRWIPVHILDHDKRSAQRLLGRHPLLYPLDLKVGEAGMNNAEQKYDVFISYRREGGIKDAMLLRNALKDRGYSVFLDMNSLRNGRFGEQLYQHIDNCTDFILVLPPNALDRCTDEEDRFHRRGRRLSRGPAASCRGS